VTVAAGGGVTPPRQTIDFLLTAHRDKKAALRFFRKAFRQHGLPEKVTIDKSGANTAALEALQEGTRAKIEIRQMKRIVRPMLGFKSFWSARRTLAGIELMHMLKKDQMLAVDGQKLSAAEQFYSLAA
jgi:transposase-like protein